MEKTGEWFQSELDSVALRNQRPPGLTFFVRYHIIANSN